jgi:hypothetical protein
MTIRVFHAGMNPSVDRFSFKQSKAQAAEIVTRGQGEYVTLEDGRQAVMLYRPRSDRQVLSETSIACLETKLKSGLPPREVPGVFFRAPESHNWKLAHRLTLLTPNVPTGTLVENSAS